MAYLETDSPISVGNNGGNCGGFGYGNDAWVLIILFALIFGWGNNGNGYGVNRGSGGGIVDGYVLASDFSNIERKIDGVNNGLCDGFYAMNTGMLNGFGNITQTIMQNGFETRNAVQGVSSQLADCCCKTQSAIQGVNFNIAQQTNAINQTLCNGFRDVVDTQNANYRALHDEIVANRIEDKNAQIAAQQNEITALRLAASQSAQNAYLISELKPCPKPAYITCNPYQSYPSYNVCCGATGTCGSVL